MNLRYAGIVLILLLAGCSASHTASSISVLPGAPSLTSQGVDPFNLNTKNVIHRYVLPNPASGPTYLATGSDKNEWFTEDAYPVIGRITPSGVITEFPIPSGHSGLNITAGASGTLWFTEGGAIGKITTAGHVHEFPLPSGDAAEGGIARGPDGNIWYTDYFTNSIGKMTPSGTVTEYLIPTSQAEPVEITAGPDGNLWFTEETYSAHSVGKITPGGTITEYGTGLETFAIAAGPDGNLYATSAGNVVEITTAGVVTTFPGCSGGIDIVLGPDKQMWMSGCSFATEYLQEFNPKTQTFSAAINPTGTPLWGLDVGGDGDVGIADNGDSSILVYEEKITTIGIRLNGELSFTDPNYGFELGYAVGTTSTQTQTLSLSMGESVQFKNVDTIPHSAAFLGNATSNSAPWPGSFNGSTTKSPAGTAIGTTGWATGSLNPNKTSPIYETGLPGFYMIGCQYHYNTNEMRTVIVVH